MSWERFDRNFFALVSHKPHMERHSHRILSQHFSLVKHKLLSFSEHFKVAKHGDVKGYGREALAGEFLKTHLPDQIDILTGEIIDTEDLRSGQIDIILQSKKSPRIPLWGNIHLSYADSVIAAIEVKSDLNKNHLIKSLDASAKLKKLKREVELIGRKSMVPLNHIPYIVFAYTGSEVETLLKNINHYGSRNRIKPNDYVPDMIVVLDKDYYVCRNDGWQFPIVPGGFLRHWDGLPDENLVGLYNFLRLWFEIHCGIKRLCGRF